MVRVNAVFAAMLIGDRLLTRGAPLAVLIELE
jgi:hypothetical protein